MTWTQYVFTISFSLHHCGCYKEVNHMERVLPRNSSACCKCWSVIWTCVSFEIVMSSFCFSNVIPRVLIVVQSELGSSVGLGGFYFVQSRPRSSSGFPIPVPMGVGFSCGPPLSMSDQI